MITVQIEGFDNARAALAALGHNIDQALDAAVHAGALLIENEAKLLAPKLSGTLARSITSERETATVGVVVYRVGTNLEYAAAQEFGATITPKTAVFLHFYTADGTEIFTRGPVKIPAQPYLRPAFDTQRDVAVAEIGRVLGQFARAA